MDIKKSVSVIIPNYNGKHLLQEYLPYTQDAVKNAGIVYEIIVIDDGSTDDSVSFLQSAYPEIILIINTENKGFSYSCNRGIEVAGKELILLLSAGVKLNPDYFEHQWKYFLRWDTFGVMGRVVDLDSDHILEAANVPDLDGMKLKTAYSYYTKDDTHRLLTFYLSATNALFDAAKLKKIGGFYGLFSPFYCEDIELSVRAWRLKWNCYYEHKAVCRHEAPASKIRSDYCDLYYLQAIHLNGLALVIWYLQITITDLLPKLFTGKTRIWKSYTGLIKNRKLIRRYKQQVKTLMDNKESDTTIADVVKKIRSSIKNKKVFRLNP